MAFSGCAAAEPKERAFRDAVFAPSANGPLKLDLYVPPAAKPPPVVVWFHGGGWRFGDKRLRLLVRDLTRDGFAVATVGYRLSTSAKWPAQREDCLAALQWLRKNADALGIDAGCMGLAGDSAGGHLAALLGVMEGTPRIKAVFAIYPPTDLNALAQFHGYKSASLLTDLFGGPVAEKTSEVAAASPVNLVDPMDPPFLFLHGDLDLVVPLDQSRALQKKLRESGVEATLILAKGKGHAFLLNREELKAAAEFFQKHLN